jgi:hypothetical protein
VGGRAHVVLFRGSVRTTFTFFVLTRVLAASADADVAATDGTWATGGCAGHFPPLAARKRYLPGRVCCFIVGPPRDALDSCSRFLSCSIPDCRACGRERMWWPKTKRAVALQERRQSGGSE